jgi:putative flavoprotein involved in K+ transport
MQDPATSVRTEHVETVVIGGGQAGLSVGHHLARLGRPFVILDASERTGDVWRQRWDSLRLFTPAWLSSLDGQPFPAERYHFPTKDEMGDYLETYARHFDLPIRHGVRVQRLAKNGDRYVVDAAGRRFEADNVVVAIGTFQTPRVPGFADQLDLRIRQLHSSRYRNPRQLQVGDVLIVGAGNSGAEIAMDIVRQRDGAAPRVWLAGRSNGQVPFRIEGWFGRHIGAPVVTRFLFRHVLSVRTPIGRKVRPKVLGHGGPLIRVKPRDLARAGVERAPRVTGVEAGKPVLADGRTLDVANVIWCTGYHPGFDWIDLPIHGEHEPDHERGVVPSHPGLYFVGLFFLESLASEMIHGVGRDAARIATHLDARMSRLPSVSKQLRTVAPS